MKNIYKLDTHIQAKRQGEVIDKAIENIKNRNSIVANVVLIFFYICIYYIRCMLILLVAILILILILHRSAPEYFNDYEGKMKVTKVTKVTEGN